LFHTIGKIGPVGPTELAEKTHLSERYLREWLGCMASNGYLEHDSAEGRFGLTPEQAAILTDRDSRTYMIPYVCYLPSFSSVLGDLSTAFRNGGGVPFEKYGADLVEAIGIGNRPWFVNDYVAKWIPAMPDIQTRLTQGGRVAEMGCGMGWSSIALALGFPNIRLDAVDADHSSIQQAQQNARLAGVENRITFHRASIEDSTIKGPYDLVTAFECIHDLAYPVRALRRMRELVDPRGSVLVADEAVGETIEENSNPLGQMMYNFSVLHCLPSAVGFPGSAATGAVIAPSTMRAYAAEAGFRSVEVLAVENPIWRFYKLIP
jgi:2-polyprenyl-3-methyl-5-hydroxy-6-metoxy-1,4-benzoquinol methylase